MQKAISNYLHFYGIFIWIVPLLAGIPGKNFAGDTVFSSPPNTRLWNPEYVQTVFIDNFNGNKIDTTVWHFNLCKSRGYNGNNEAGPENVEVSNGSLKLWARYEPANVDSNCWENQYFVSDYTTAEIYTLLHRYKYGCFEARCLIPRGDHFYYAYWLWGPGGDGYPSDGFISEIDIAEGVEWSDGTNHEMKSAFHYWSQTDGEIPLTDTWQHGYDTIYEGDWHTYKIIWNPYDVTFVFDNKQVWKRTNYYTGNDLRKNDVEMNEIIRGKEYYSREYFPNDEMETVFQMHVKKDVGLNELPAAMEIDYVKVSQFFLAPQIRCPDVINDSANVVLDVDANAKNISWKTDPEGMFEEFEGTGNVAKLVVKPGKKGDAIIFYTFQMPTGETFFAEIDFLVDQTTSAKTNLNKFKRSNQLQITPNPSGEWVTIKPEMQKNWSLQVFNTGKQLMLKLDNLSENSFRLNVSGWTPGVYLVVVKDRELISSGKLVVL